MSRVLAHPPGSSAADDEHRRVHVRRREEIPAGATHPYGDDPRDRTIRLAPTFPSLTDLERAMRGLVTCVRLAADGC